MTKGYWACARICLFQPCYSQCREDSSSDLDEDSNVVSEGALGGWSPEYGILDLQDGEFPRSHHEDWEQSETDDEAGQSCQIAGPKHQ